MIERVPPPPSRDALMKCAEGLAGRTIGWVAERAGQWVPADLRQHKGWVGELIEAALGATAGSKAEPDFPDLAVELKTIPVDASGKSRESTYVCVAPIDGSLAHNWEASWVRRKLATVLWVPIVSGKDTALADRRVGRPFLWSPDTTQSAALQTDWEALAEMIHSGSFWMIRGEHGKVLQLRPKAANAKELDWVIDDEGEWVRTTPLGFYLRARFTRGLIEGRFRLDEQNAARVRP